jgi:hypothetical protein
MPSRNDTASHYHTVSLEYHAFIALPYRLYWIPYVHRFTLPSLLNTISAMNVWYSAETILKNDEHWLSVETILKGTNIWFPVETVLKIGEHMVSYRVHRFSLPSLLNTIRSSLYLTVSLEYHKFIALPYRLSWIPCVHRFTLPSLLNSRDDTEKRRALAFSRDDTERDEHMVSSRNCTENRRAHGFL